MNNTGRCWLVAVILSLLALSPKLIEAATSQTSIEFLQEQTEHESKKKDNTKGEHRLTKTVSVSGTVSNDAKTLVTDKDGRTWVVSNPEVLRGYEGRQVKVKGRTAADKTEIQVLSVKIQRTYNRTPEQP